MRGMDNKKGKKENSIIEESLVDILRIEGINAKGFGSIPKIVMKDRRLPIHAKAVYAYFCSYAGAGNQAFPGREIILNDLQISKDFYYKNLKLLKDCDYIRVKREMGKGGKFGRNIYTLVPCPIAQDMVLSPCPVSPDTVVQDININRYKKDIDLSINPKYINADTMDRMDEYSGLIKDNIEYDMLLEQVQNKNLLKSIYVLMIDSLCSDERVFKINGVSMEARLVKRRLLELRQADISAVIVGIERMTAPIHNPRNYLLTALYNAPATSETKWAAEIGSTMKTFRNGSR
jgi:hypothetical protein